MTIKRLYIFFVGCLLFFFLFSCGKDDNMQTPICDVFSSPDSVCFCATHVEDLKCTDFKISVFSKADAPLIPTQTNGTIWSKGFAIDHSIYIIDRTSETPHSFFKLDVQKNDAWEVKASFPGNKYGLTGAANGKGYASSYASKKFWEYDPEKNEWTALNDLPFAPGETHWVEYNGKFYVPDYDGIFEFDASTREWNKISSQTSSGFGAIFIVGDDMYWYTSNNSYMSRFNFVDKSYEKVPHSFSNAVSFERPFVIEGTAFITFSYELWIFDAVSKTWSSRALKSGSAHGDDVFVIDGKAYLIDNGSVKVFEVFAK